MLVSNDLATDQRVRKMCATLIQKGYSIELIGRMLPHSLPLKRSYKTRRLKLMFNQGALFYAELNLRLFFFLLFSNFDRIHANDLDTLLPAFLISKIKRKPLVYDSHELFTEVPEIQGRWVKKVWVSIENFVFPRLRNIITVNDSIADFYRKKYHKTIEVVRNIPEQKAVKKTNSRGELNLPIKRFICIVQGAGINVDRGIEETVESLKNIENCLLLIVGSGDALPKLKALVKTLNLSSKVSFIGRLPYEEMMQYTMNSDLGITVDKPTSLNYEYSLPNKLFDYIRAQIPVLASPLVEVKRVVETYGVGQIVSEVTPDALQKGIQKFMDDSESSKRYALNLKKASEELSWEKEEEKLHHIYPNL